VGLVVIALGVLFLGAAADAQTCQSMYGPHSTPASDKPGDCKCRDGYSHATVRGKETCLQNCWVDVTSHEGCGPDSERLLQFKNTCSTWQPINVCVRWTTGASAGGSGSNRAADAKGGKVAIIKLGHCSIGNVRYSFNANGSVPECR